MAKSGAEEKGSSALESATMLLLRKTTTFSDRKVCLLQHLGYMLQFFPFWHSQSLVRFTSNCSGVLQRLAAREGIGENIMP